MIRLAGQGARGGRGPAGRPVLEVHFKPHPRYRVEGRDLHLTLQAAPWEAALGAVVAVELPDGTLKVRIRGRPERAPVARARQGNSRRPPGDLLLRIEVVLPPATTRRRGNCMKPWRGSSPSIRAAKGEHEPCATTTS